MSDTNADTSIANVEQVFSMQYNHLRNKQLNQNYIDFSLVYHNYDITTFRYLQDDDKQGIKIENVLAKYVVVENRDLKELLTKFGVKDVSKIPNTLPKESVKTFIETDKEKINTIFNDYKNILIESLNEKNFKKLTNEDKTTTISLVLSEKEVADILEKYLSKLKTDNDTLTFIINKANTLGYKLNIDSFKTFLQESIDDLNSRDFYSNGEFIKIAITSDKEKTKKLDFKISIREDEEKATKEYAASINLANKNQIFIDINNNNKKNSIKINFGYEGNGISTNIEFYEIDENTKQEKNLGKILHRVNNNSSTRINQDLTLISNDPTDNSSMNLNIGNTILLKQDIEIEKINDQNSFVINDNSKEEIDSLIKAIIDRMDFVFGEKLDIKNFVMSTNE